jgi:pentatricopeptide repeat protein
MVQGYGRAGMLRETRDMFDAMPERNMVSWTIMVKAYADRCRFQEAMELFDRNAVEELVFLERYDLQFPPCWESGRGGPSVREDAA